MDIFQTDSIAGVIFWGLVTAAIASLLTAMAKPIWLALYDYLSFRQGRVDGVWTAKNENQYAYFGYTMTIRQRADRLDGTLQIARTEKVPGGPGTYIRNFSLEGRKLESFFALTLISSDDAHWAVIGGAFHAVNQGNGLESTWSYRATTSNQVRTENLVWSK